MNLAASSKRPCEGEERMPSLETIDEGQGNCSELGTAVKNPPAYRERHGLKDNAVNWGDPPHTGEKIFFKEPVERRSISPEDEVNRLWEGSPRGL